MNAPADLRLSALDQSPIRSGGTPAQAVAETLELAQLCDRLGYHRYWLAEHHSSSALAGSTPEILMARVAALTKRIRVGSGGVMLSHYAPLKVAENFRMLETLFPGRIDLGIGRAPGSDQRTAMALANGQHPLPIEYFPHQIRDTIAFLHNELPRGHASSGVIANPAGEDIPEIWLLGSSDQSAAYAAHFGLPFSFAHFINPQGGPEVVKAYRQHFQPSPLHTKPEVSVGISVLCAPTQHEAERLAKSRDVWAMRLRTTGEPGPIPSIEEAEAFVPGPEQAALLRAIRARSIVGDPDKVRAGLLAMAELYQADELVCVTICYDHAARLGSYQLVAQAMHLPARQQAA